jgi:hypothetical protein
MKKIAVFLFPLFSTLFCFAQTPEQKPANESLTACPDFSNKKTSSKAAYFQFLKSNSKKAQQQPTYPSSTKKAEKAESTAAINTATFPKSALPDYSTLEKENKAPQKERRKHLIKDKSETEIAKTASPIETIAIANKSTSTENKIAPIEKRKQLFKEKEKTKVEITETAPLAEPAIVENTEKPTNVADKTSDLAEKVMENTSHKKGFKLKNKSKIPSPKKQKRAARRKATKCPEF